VAGSIRASSSVASTLSGRPQAINPSTAHSISAIAVIRSVTLLRRGAADQTITSGRNLLFVGAKGFGKTRAGIWLEVDSSYKGLVFKICAQKSLSVPETTTPMSFDLAQRNLVFGLGQAAGRDVDRVAQPLCYIVDPVHPIRL